MTGAPAPAPTPDDAARQRLLLAADKFDQREGAQPHLFLEVDVATCFSPETLVSQRVRVLWPDDAAWYLGTVAAYDPATAEHTVHYDDGAKERVVAALQRMRVLLGAGEAPPQTPSGDLQRYAEALLAQADTLKCASKEGEELRARAAQLQAVTAPEPPAAEGRPAAPPLLAPAPGEVVWAKVNGFPDWPAMVVTLEQAIDGARPPKTRGAVPICYFGTFERQAIRPSCVTPFRAGVAAGFHLKRSMKQRKFAAAVCEAADYLAVSWLQRFLGKRGEGIWAPACFNTSFFNVGTYSPCQTPSLRAERRGA